MGSKSRRNFYSKRKRVEIHKTESGSIFVRLAKIRIPPKKLPFVAIDFIPEKEYMVFNGAGSQNNEQKLKNIKRFISRSIKEESY